MKLFERNLKHGKIKAYIENLDDLWYLSHIVSKGDLVSGKTFRKIRIGDSDNAKVVKKPFFLQIEVERVEFHKYSDVLRVSGIVKQGPEEVTTGSHHTFNFEENTEFSLEKKEFLTYQIDKLKEATSDKAPPILLVVLDREESYLALMKKYGCEHLTHITGNVQKKGFDQQEGNFYKDLLKVIVDYDARMKFEGIIIASPAFFKEDFMKVASSIKEKITLATVSSVDKSAFNELLKRDEVKAVLKKDKVTKETRLVDELMFEISKEGKSSYGLQETADAANAGAVETLLVSDALIHSMRENNNYEELDFLMQLVDKNKGKVHIVSSDHDGGKQLDGLSGVGAILRYKLN